jgi:peptidoglycan/LPS O-acetylase OafA/YrhL
VFVAVLFVALMYLPGTGMFNPWKAEGVLNGYLDLSVMFFFMPLMLLIAVGSESYGGRFAKVARFFGELSFPVYMSHYMFMPMHRYYVKTYSANLPDWGNYLVFAGEYLVILLIGYGVMNFWEVVKPRRASIQRNPGGIAMS